MSEKIKLIWDFRGTEAALTASHHATHLKQYAAIRNLPSSAVGDQALSSKHHIAYIIVLKENMLEARDALKPHRGEYYDPET